MSYYSNVDLENKKIEEKYVKNKFFITNIFPYLCITIIK